MLPAFRPTPEQLALFPVDGDESMLLDQCRRYVRLPDKQRALVTAYLRILRRVAGMPTTSEWLDEAGIARSTGYEILKESAGDIDAAIAEALQVCGIRGARHAALALPLAGQMILSSLQKGGRSTSSLTSVELGILRDCAAIGGLLLPAGPSQARASVSVQDAKGNSVTLSVDAGGEQDGVAKALLELRARQGWTDGEAFMRGAVESVQVPSGRQRPAVLAELAKVDQGGAVPGNDRLAEQGGSKDAAGNGLA